MCSLGRTAALVLLAFIIVGSSFSTANAHYMNAKIEIYKAITIPVIDGTYNMTPREIDLNGTKVIVDEWNDAAWVDLPRESGNLTAYSGFKYDGQYLYIATAVPSITESSYRVGSHWNNDKNNVHNIWTYLDPRHDGGKQECRVDDFGLVYSRISGSNICVKYCGSDGKYPYLKCPSPSSSIPQGLDVKARLSVSPFSLTPHLFYEEKIPLTLGDLYKYVNSTVGLLNGASNDKLGINQFPGPGAFIVDDYGDVTFGKTANTNPTVPPMIVPEFPIRAAPLVIVATLVALVLISKRKFGVCPHRDTQRDRRSS